MVFDCLWVVVEFFEVVVDGDRSFLILVTTQNEVNNCGKVTWTEVGGFVRVSRTNFKIHFPLTRLAAFSHTF